MDIATLIKILLRHIKVIAIIPLFVALLAILATLNKKKDYTSSLSIFTGITSGLSIGNLDGNSRVDMFNTNNQFDNFINILKSKETNEEVALRLLAQNLSLKAPHPIFISKENYQNLKKSIPVEIHDLVVDGDTNQTYSRFVAFKNRSSDNFLVYLLASNDPHYSLNAISQMGIKRVGNSDLVNITYVNNDPGITYQTLRILSEVFIKNYKQIRQMQTDAVVKYFERELAKVSVRLRDAEDRLLAYYKNNSVINYNEQTRYIAEQKEYFETDYVREKMNFASTRASAFALENKMNARDRIFLKNDSIVRLRNELYAMNLKQTENRLNMRDSVNVGKSWRARIYQKQIDSLVGKLNESIVGSMRLQSSVEGIAADKILNQWLDYVVSNEASRAKIEVMDNRLKNFRDIYASLAPVGATIKRIEREIDINEQQYLSVLHGLNMAKLKMQDVEMSSTIKVLDKPLFPLTSRPSNRKMIVAAAFIGSMLLMVAIIIALELLDKSIRTAERASNLLGLKVMGVYPHMYKRKIWLEDVAAHLVRIMARDVANHKDEVPIRVGVISTIDGEGRTTISNKLNETLNLMGYRAKIDDVKNIRSSSEADTDIFIYDLPSILLSPVSLEIIKSIGLFILVVRANREWRPSDARALLVFNEGTAKRPVIVLNGVEEDGLEHYLGDLPKQRSQLRIWAKKILTLNFFGKERF